VLPLDGLDRGFGCSFCLKVDLQDVDVAVEPLQVLLLDNRYALHHFSDVEHGLEVCELIRSSGWGLAFDEGERVRADAEALEVCSRDVS
jgi:hypothetical protein